MKKIVLLAAMGMFGCTQKTMDYYYVSLENVSDIEVTSRGKIKTKNLKENSNIPFAYSLRRDSYNLQFIIGNKSYFPHFKISVDASSGRVFHLSPRRNKQIVSDSGVICASYYLADQNLSNLHFGWSSDCLSENIQKNISFDVIDEKGKLIYQENIPFELKKDGRYTLIDAI